MRDAGNLLCPIVIAKSSPSIGIIPVLSISNPSIGKRPSEIIFHNLILTKSYCVFKFNKAKDKRHFSCKVVEKQNKTWSVANAISSPLATVLRTIFNPSKHFVPSFTASKRSKSLQMLNPWELIKEYPANKNKETNPRINATKDPPTHWRNHGEYSLSICSWKYRRQFSQKKRINILILSVLSGMGGTQTK